MSINDDAMADLSKLPEPDYIHVSKLEEPIGSGRSWKFPAMREMLQRAESAEKQRDELLYALKLCAAVCSGETMHKNGLINALEAARTALANAKGA